MLLLVFTVVCASCAQRADINYRIVTEQPLQVMEHFGASDAWSMHVLGKWALRETKTYSRLVVLYLTRREREAQRYRSFPVAVQSGCREHGAGRRQPDWFSLDAYRMFLAAGREL